MNYYLFLDESGDHGLNKIDPGFPIFVLCGVLLSEGEYELLAGRITALKQEFWPDKKVILHSRDIRKCEKEFAILLDLDVKNAFYHRMNQVVVDIDFSVIAAAIDKVKHFKKYGYLADDVYKISLSFII